MGLEARMMEMAAVRRERSDLGGYVIFPGCPPVPCSMGPDTSGLSRADNSAGLDISQTRCILVRSALLKDLPVQPKSGDTVEVRGNLETESVFLEIMPTTGIENYNAIITAFNLANPNL